MAVLGLRFCVRAFSSCGKWGPLFIAVRGPLIIVASLVAEHRLQTRRLSNCGSRAQSLHGMWDPPRPGLEPVSPALAGRLSTTAPPGKPISLSFLKIIFRYRIWTWSYFVAHFNGNLRFITFRRKHVHFFPTLHSSLYCCFHLVFKNIAIFSWCLFFLANFNLIP